jgi:serine/threonine protein kinase
MLLSDKYKITRVITKSTYSTLYEGEHIHKKHKVAIKLECDEICKKLLENEINMYLYLKRHSKINIPNIKYIGTYDKYKYIVMELLDKNLKQYINNKVSNYKFLLLIEQLFLLIQQFHSRKLVHRDIKPENFVFNTKEELCIIDLGLSTFKSEREMKHFIGNKRYASYTCHSDVYIYKETDDIISIIYMLFDLYTNVLPWDDKFINFNIKKNANFEEFYKSKNQYDDIVEVLIYCYNKRYDKDFYTCVFNELRCTIYNYHP